MCDRTRSFVFVWASLGLFLALGACGGIEDGAGAGWQAAAGKADGEELEPIPPELVFATQVRRGDIILTNVDAGRGCWYFNRLENWALNPRYCHAALVVDRTGETGITTIEALNTGQDIQVMQAREHALASRMQTKLAVLRVVDEADEPLSEEAIQAVVDLALKWQDVQYLEPPIDLHGDPHQSGLYCSMLPFRAYLDALGVDLDSVRVPFVVTPDELYDSPRSIVVFESAPGDPPPASAPPL